MLLRGMQRRSSYPGTRKWEEERYDGDLSGRKEIMSTQSKKKMSDPESVRKRLENSLPWSLSRWLSRVILARTPRSKIRIHSGVV
jgi:hypothetical protein